MSMTEIDSWAVDLADVTFIYPWVGSEVVMAIVGIALWILWHIWQLRHENQTYEEEAQKYANAEHMKRAADND